MALTICVLLWAVPGQERSLVEYEDRVLALLPAHEARLLTRVRAREEGPFEVQVIEFPSEQALTEFVDDPQRVSLAELRERAIARTELTRVEMVSG